MTDERPPVAIWTPGRGDPVPKDKRNPRRDYDPNGREIRPGTIANCRLNGTRGLLMLCKCGHEATVPFDGIADETFVPDVALRLRCTACGADGRDIETRPDFAQRAAGGARA